MAHLVNGHLLQQSLGATEDYSHLFGNRHRTILGLLEDFHITGALVKDSLGGSIQVGAKFGEGLQLTILSLVQLQGTCNLLHGLNLSLTTHTRHRNTHINSRPDARIEEVGL